MSVDLYDAWESWSTDAFTDPDPPTEFDIFEAGWEACEKKVRALIREELKGLEQWSAE